MASNLPRETLAFYLTCLSSQVAQTVNLDFLVLRDPFHNLFLTVGMDGVLEIRSLTRQDAGEYKCHAHNAADSKVSRGGQLVVTTTSGEFTVSSRDGLPLSLLLYEFRPAFEICRN